MRLCVCVIQTCPQTLCRMEHATVNTCNAGKVIYGASHRTRLGSDALEVGKVAPKCGIWPAAFHAVGRINKGAVKDLPAGVDDEWKRIVSMEGADAVAGSVEAAMWMSKAVVRTACNHDLVDWEKVPGPIRDECGVNPADRVHPPPPAPHPEPPITKRNRDPSKAADVKELGGPVVKQPRGDPPKGEEGSEHEENAADDDDDQPYPEDEAPKRPAPKGPLPQLFAGKKKTARKATVRGQGDEGVSANAAGDEHASTCMCTPLARGSGKQTLTSGRVQEEHKLILETPRSPTRIRAPVSKFPATSHLRQLTKKIVTSKLRVSALHSWSSLYQRVRQIPRRNS